MSSQKPLISIVVPCYNQARYIDDCLSSVVSQSFSNWQCIVINDGSQDNIDQVIRPWLELDSRISYIKQKNRGVSVARNVAIEASTAQWILPLDADDKISSDYLELASREFDKNYKLIYAKAQLFGNMNCDWNLKEYSKKDLAIDNMIYNSAFFRKADWKAVGGYDENNRLGLEDWDFWLMLLKDAEEEQVLRLNHICFYYRKKDNSRLTDLAQDTHKLHRATKNVHKKHAEFVIEQLDPLNTLYDYKYEHESFVSSRLYKTYMLLREGLKKVGLKIKKV